MEQIRKFRKVSMTLKETFRKPWQVSLRVMAAIGNFLQVSLRVRKVS